MFSWLFSNQKESLKHEHAKPKEEFVDVTPLAQYFEALTGVTFEKQTSILNSKARSFALSHNIYSYEELLKRIKEDDFLKQKLINRLTTNETFFYREFAQIAQLVKEVQKESHKVRILCAPCATGEEPYSIAIALLEAGVKENDFFIVGIDINSDAIKKAKEGVYKERNMRNLSESIQAKYFEQKDKSFCITESVKKLVDFQIVNIFDDKFQRLEKFDYLFSRNMLIYFDQETKRKARKILESMLKDRTKEIYFGHADLF